MVAPKPRYLGLVSIVEEEEPFEIGSRRWAVVTAETGRLLVREELDSHSHTVGPMQARCQRRL